MGLTQCIKLIYILQVLHLVAFVFQVCELMMQLLQQPLGHSENTGIHIRERIDLKGAFTSCFVSHFDTNIFKGILEGKLVFIYVSQQPYTRRMESSQDSTFHQIEHQPTMWLSTAMVDNLIKSSPVFIKLVGSRCAYPSQLVQCISRMLYWSNEVIKHAKDLSFGIPFFTIVTVSHLLSLGITWWWWTAWENTKEEKFYRSGS